MNEFNEGLRTVNMHNRIKTEPLRHFNKTEKCDEEIDGKQVMTEALVYGHEEPELCDQEIIDLCGQLKARNIEAVERCNQDGIDQNGRIKAEHLDHIESEQCDQAGSDLCRGIKRELPEQMQIVQADQFDSALYEMELNKIQVISSEHITMDQYMNGFAKSDQDDIKLFSNVKSESHQESSVAVDVCSSRKAESLPGDIHVRDSLHGFGTKLETVKGCDNINCGFEPQSQSSCEGINIKMEPADETELCPKFKESDMSKPPDLLEMVLVQSDFISPAIKTEPLSENDPDDSQYMSQGLEGVTIKTEPLPETGLGSSNFQHNWCSVSSATNSVGQEREVFRDDIDSDTLVIKMEPGEYAMTVHEGKIEIQEGLLHHRGVGLKMEPDTQTDEMNVDETTTDETWEKMYTYSDEVIKAMEQVSMQAWDDYDIAVRSLNTAQATEQSAILTPTWPNSNNKLSQPVVSVDPGDRASSQRPDEPSTGHQTRKNSQISEEFATRHRTCKSHYKCVFKCGVKFTDLDGLLLHYKTCKHMTKKNLEMSNKNVKRLPIVRAKVKERAKELQFRKKITSISNKPFRSISVKKPFACEHCSKRFQWRVDLDCHERVCQRPSDDKKYKCESCDKQFELEMSLKIHTCDDVQIMCAQLMCSKCYKKFPSEKGLSHHLLNCGKHETCKKWTCQNCSEEFPTEKLLACHLLLCDDETCETSVCKNCSVTFPSNALLAAHLLICDSSILQAYMCTKCHDTFPSVTLFDRHRLTCSGTTPFGYIIGRKKPKKPLQCSNCDTAFEVSADFHSHVSTSSETGSKPTCKKSFVGVCMYCNASFDSSEVYMAHTCTLPGKQLYKCSYCDELFSQFLKLSEHEASHEDKLIYQ